MTTFYGLGDEEPLGTARSVVALPKRVQCRAGETTPITLAYESGVGSIALSLGAARLGAVRAGAGIQALYTPASGTVGQEDSFFFTLVQGLRSSIARVICEIIEGEPTGTEWTYTESTIPGGAIGSGGRFVISNQTFRTDSWMKTANRDYVNCRIIGNAATDSEDLAKNIRLINCTIEDMSGGPSSDRSGKYVFYVNLGHKELKHGFVMYGGAFLRCTAVEFFETKGFDPMLIGVDFRGSPGVADGFRFRFGFGGMIVGCRGLKEVTLRSHHAAVVNCPETTVSLLSGKLPSRIEQWLPLHEAGGGDNWQHAEVCYVEAVKAVKVGLQQTSGETKPALNCVVHPSQSNVSLLTERGTRRAALKNYAAVQAIP